MMKNLLLMGLAFTAGMGVTNAQTKHERIKVSKADAMPVEYKLDGDAYFTGARKAQTPSKGRRVTSAGFFGTQIGITYYDLQSNAAVANRIVRSSDGTISATWTETCNPSAATSFPNRGAGYNYYNGTTWINGATSKSNEFTGTCSAPGTSPSKAFGIASKRVGWPEMLVLPNGKEGVITHSTSDGINFTSRTPKGQAGATGFTTTDLTFSQNVGGTGVMGTWPRAVSSGNTIHMIYCLNKTVATGSPSEPTVNGVQNPFVYSRSTDGGVTWDKQNIAMPNLDKAHGYTRIGGDGYAISANGQNVAIVAGYFGQPWTLWKSTDGGTTWTQKYIKQFSTAAHDTVMFSPTDTIAQTNDASHAVVVDDQGTVHVWAGRIFIRCTVDAAGHVVPGSSWYPGVGRELLYWNDKMAAGTEPEVIAKIENNKPIGDPDDFVASDPNHRAPYGTMGLVSMPNGAFKSNGGTNPADVYVVYSGVVEGASNGGAQGEPFRDLHIIYRPGTGTNAGKWSNSINISRSLNLFGPGVSAADQGEEDVFPSVSHEIGSDNKLHTVWQSDFEPGMNLGADADPETQNATMYSGFNLSTFAFNWNPLGLSKDMDAYVNEIKAYPNPTNGKVSISIDLKKNANVRVSVKNIMGQEVASFAPKALSAGKNSNAVEVDMSNLANGVYLYTVSSDEFTTTSRIVKQ